MWRSLPAHSLPANGLHKASAATDGTGAQLAAATKSKTTSNNSGRSAHVHDAASDISSVASTSSASTFCTTSAAAYLWRFLSWMWPRFRRSFSFCFCFCFSSSSRSPSARQTASAEFTFSALPLVNWAKFSASS